MTATNVSLEQIKAGMLTPGIYLSAAQFTFSIANSASAWTDDYASGSEPYATGYGILNADQAAAFRLAMSSWDRLIAPDFKEVTDTASQHGEVRIAFAGMDANTAGYAFQSSEKTPFSKAGDVWLSSTTAGQSFAVGTDNFETLVHEIGHVMGLKHPFSDPKVPEGFDNQRYTVMSYTPINPGYAYGFVLTETGSLKSATTKVNATTPMVFDIAAVQALYGADQKTGAGNDVYRFEESSTVIQSLYDAGGIDTVDLSNFARPVLLDLTPGAYSSLGFWSEADQVAHWTATHPNFTTFIQNFFAQRDAYTWTDNLGIAFSTQIENAIGGAGNDVLVGNALANALSGGGGGDRITPGGGRNSVDGGAGDDVLVLSGARADYKIFSVGGFDFLIGASDQHKVTGFEQATFAGGTVNWADVKAGSAAFDASAYLAANADLVAVFGTNTAAAANHYVQYGFAEGRPTGSSGAAFDALSYLAANADLSRIFGLNLHAATDHYNTYGIKEGRPTSGFDATLYLASNADLSRHFGLNPTAATRHFVEYGAKEGRPTTSFDAMLYLASNADLSRHFGLNLQGGIKHFVEYGAKEGRPTSGFDPMLYLASHADLSRALGLDTAAATRHYLQYGADEGRATRSFDPISYIASHADLARILGVDPAAGVRHYIVYGADEGRATSGFDPMRYIASHADLIRHIGPNAARGTDHYLRYGADEGRSTTSFDPMRYLDANPDLVAVFGRDAAAASNHYVRWGFNEGRPTGSTAAGPEAVHAVFYQSEEEPGASDAVDEAALSHWLADHLLPDDSFGLAANVFVEPGEAPLGEQELAIYAVAWAMNDLGAPYDTLNVAPI